MLDWIIKIIDTGGYFGVLIAMFLENLFPPIPSELVMLFSGIAAKEGDMNITAVIVMGTIGAVLGLLPWYYAGKWYGQERLARFADTYGRLLTFSGKDVRYADEWFVKHGGKTVFISRFLPAVRTLIAIPAAIGEMKLSTFLIFSFLGSLAYDGIIAYLGYAVSGYESLETYINAGTSITLIIVVVWYIYRVINFRK